MLEMEISLLVSKKSLFTCVRPVTGIISWANGWLLQNILEVIFLHRDWRKKKMNVTI